MGAIRILHDLRYRARLFKEASRQENTWNLPKWTFERLSQMYADVEFLKKETKQSVSKICRCLRQQKPYANRWREFSHWALRKAYATAKKRRDPMFELELCGPDAMIAAKGIDRIDAAIEHHALKVRV